MKYILAALCFLCAALAGAQTLSTNTTTSGNLQLAQMIPPKVEHRQRTETQTYDEVTRSCPVGYEGHFVDKQEGFDGISRWGGIGFNWEGGEPGYTVCFKKEFMDEIRKNPELLVARPVLKPV